MRGIAVSILLAGCSFSASGSADGRRAGDAGVADASAIDADVTPGECGAALEPALRLCIDFEARDPVQATDGSGRGNHARLTNVASIARTTPTGGTSFAAGCAGDCEMRIAESASLDLDVPVTLSLWVRADASPDPGERYGLVDNNTQYAVFYQDDDAITCSVFRSPSQSTTVRSSTVSTGAWAHVACVADAGVVAIYLDGVFAGSATFTGPLHTGNSKGTLLGQDLASSGAGDETLVGALDDVRIWNRGLTPTQICQQAGLLGC